MTRPDPVKMTCDPETWFQLCCT